MKYSYTQWALFKTCPFAYHAKYVDKVVPYVQSDAALEGTRIHERLERYIQGETAEIPGEVHESWFEDLKDLRDSKPKSELKVENDIAIGYIDAYSEQNHLIVDFKTGTPRVYDLIKRQQLSFYVWLLHVEGPVRGELWWVQHPKKSSVFSGVWTFNKSLDDSWRKRLEKLKSGNMTQCPGWFCSYCGVEACEHHKTSDT